MEEDDVAAPIRQSAVTEESIRAAARSEEIAGDFAAVTGDDDVLDQIIADNEIDRELDRIIAGNQSATNLSDSLLDTAQKYAASGFAAGKDLLNSAKDKALDFFGISKPKKKDNKPSADKSANSPTPAVAKFPGDDTRVKLKVPEFYIKEVPLISTSLTRTSTIIFPYTPTIKSGSSANYSSVPVTHSNYAQYFYKNSEVEKISLSAKFSVQNQKEAEQLIAVNHLFRALTKMQFGKDSLPGAPPPVCILSGLGSYFFDNVPVVVEKYSMEFSDTVDYFSYFLGEERISVPVLTTLSISLIPMFSREEILNSSVAGWMSGKDRRNGLL